MLATRAGTATTLERIPDFVGGVPFPEEARTVPRRTAPYPIRVTVKPRTEEEVLRAVLERAAEDRGFIAELTYQGSDALAPYPLTWEAKAALLSGDVRWVEGKLGKLDARLRTWLDCRLQQEIW
jgi:hypothetical protein